MSGTHRNPRVRRVAASLAALALAATAAGCTGQAHVDSAPHGNRRGQSVGNPAPRQPGDVQKPAATQAADKQTRPAPPSATPGPAASNPTVTTTEDPRSTFALDVDNGSWTRARAAIRAKQPPRAADVRTEEFVNAFPQDYLPPADGMSVQIDGTAVPWLPKDSRVLRVGVQSAVVDQSKRPDANLTFVIDVSGSMAESNKLPAVKQALRTLTASLRPTDTVAIVVYSERTRTVLPRTKVEQRSTIIGAVDDLQTEGSTNAEAGLRQGYDEAVKSHEKGRLNRVVLLSDGVANVGNTGPEAILETIGEAARKQIDLVTVGFGDPFNDPLMEQLANRGNGFYAYCDTAAECERLFRENLTGTLVVTGRDAKAQIEFDPRQVVSYRLLGYENRDVADRDFRNDKVDGGEVGSGHAVTALYELQLAEGVDPGRPLATATVRYLHPESRQPTERTATVRSRDLAASPDQAPARVQQDIVVASFSESLRQGPWAKLRTPRQVADDAVALARRLPGPHSAELVELTGLMADR